MWESAIERGRSTRTPAGTPPAGAGYAHHRVTVQIRKLFRVCGDWSPPSIEGVCRMTLSNSDENRPECQRVKFLAPPWALRNCSPRRGITASVGKPNPSRFLTLAWLVGPSCDRVILTFPKPIFVYLLTRFAFANI